MDKLELKVLQCDGAPMPQSLGAVFGIAGGTIGRGGQNKLILPGTDTAVARVHAMVRLDHEGAYIANLSESKPIWVADQAVQSGEEVRLDLQAPIRIGAYTLCAVVPGAVPATAPAAAAPAPASAAARPSAMAPALAEPAVPPATVVPGAATSSLLNSLPAASAPADVPQAAPATTAAPLASRPLVAAADTLDALLPSADAGSGGGLLDLLQSESRPTPAAATTATPAAPVAPVAPVVPAVATAHDTEAAPRNPWAANGHAQDPAPGRSGIGMDLFGSPAAAAPAPAKAPAPLASQPFPALIPDDFDPFAARPETASRAQDGWASAGLDLGNAPEVGPTRVPDDMVRSLPLQGKLDHALDDPSHAGLPQRYAAAPALDPLALFGGAGDGADPFAATTHAAARGSELSQVFNLPRSQARATDVPTAPSAPSTPAVPSTAATQAPAPAPVHVAASAPEVNAQPMPAHAPIPVVATPATPASAPAPAPAGAAQPPLPAAVPLDALAAAFIEGAGLDPSKGQFRVTPEFMRTFGEVLRVAVQGTIDLLAARSEIKREFRAGVTIIASGANNPLKFLPSAEGVIMQMTNRAFPGFMTPVPAMEEAYMDLRVHQLALMAGIRAAYAEALTRFDPSELERRTDGNPSLLDKLLANGRKAALWDDYKHNFEALRRHAEDDLMAFSGRSFLDAYEQAAHAAKDSQGPAQ